MPYVFECSICKTQSSNHTATLQLVLYDWSKEEELRAITRDTITTCPACLQKVKEALTSFYKQLGVQDGRN